MPERLFKHKVKILFVTIFIFLLIAVRVFENQLFYDPFLAYFKDQYGSTPLPDFAALKLFFALSARYFLNAFFSLGIIYIIFKDFDLTKFAALLYLFFFIVLIAGFFIVVYRFPENKMAVFYIRRFLIQPIFLLLFLPGFYFQLKSKK